MDFENEDNDSRVEKIEVSREDTDREIQQIEVVLNTLDEFILKPNSVACERIQGFKKELEKEKDYLEQIRQEETDSIAYIENE
jgi:hypothetical protein